MYIYIYIVCVCVSQAERFQNILIVGTSYAFWGKNWQIWNDFFAYLFEVILQNAYWQAWAIDGSAFASARPLNLVAFEALLS